jgi:hypothetical protein
MMPIVFCASLLPCASDIAAELTSWPRRKNRSTPAGVARRSTLNTATMIRKPMAAPRSGETAIAVSVSAHFLPHTSAARPALASAAPA